MSLKVGFVGLGDIGRPMALQLPRAGLETAVFDIAPGPVEELAAAGAKAAASPREVAAASDVVGVCVRTAAQVRSVVTGEDGLLAGARPGLVILVHSTVVPATVEELAGIAAKQDVGVLDACVSGNANAPDPQFKLFLAGDDAQREKIHPYATAIAADRLVPTGPLGSSCKAKICLNLVTYLQWLAAFESAKLARAIGLPQEVFEDVGRSNGQLTELMIAYLALHKIPEEARKGEALQNRLRGNMHVAEKDLACALELARDARVSLPGAALVSQLMAKIYAVEDPAAQ
ncbi:MAG: NAD(P)-binding domain-containing protein [Myxococcota bacterium]